MDLNVFIKGIIVGIVITAPIGPVGALVVQRTINEGRESGIVSGLGSAVGDAIYATIVAFGLTFISEMLMQQGGVGACDRRDNPLRIRPEGLFLEALVVFGK